MNHHIVAAFLEVPSLSIWRPKCRALFLKLKNICKWYNSHLKNFMRIKKLSPTQNLIDKLKDNNDYYRNSWSGAWNDNRWCNILATEGISNSLLNDSSLKYLACDTSKGFKLLRYSFLPVKFRYYWLF